MLRNTYFYENRMLTNKANQSLVWDGKGKSETLIKSLINMWVGGALEEFTIIDLKGIGLSDRKSISWYKK